MERKRKENIKFSIIYIFASVFGLNIVEGHVQEKKEID